MGSCNNKLDAGSLQDEQNASKRKAISSDEPDSYLLSIHCTQAIIGWALFAWRGEDHPWVIVHDTFLLPDGWRHSNKFKFWWKVEEVISC